MIIQNTRPKVISIGLPTGGSAPKFVIIKMGNNIIDDEVFEQIMKNPDVKAKFSSGELKLINPKEKAKTETDDAPKEGISKYNVKDAIKVVDETLDVKQLEDWKSTEDRKSVNKAIDKQIKKISDKDEDGEDNEDE